MSSSITSTTTTSADSDLTITSSSLTTINSTIGSTIASTTTSTAAASKAPYYYGELIKKDSSTNNQQLIKSQSKYSYNQQHLQQQQNFLIHENYLPPSTTTAVNGGSSGSESGGYGGIYGCYYGHTLSSKLSSNNDNNNNSSNNDTATTAVKYDDYLNLNNNSLMITNNKHKLINVDNPVNNTNNDNKQQSTIKISPLKHQQQQQHSTTAPPSSSLTTITSSSSSSSNEQQQVSTISTATTTTTTACVQQQAQRHSSLAYSSTNVQSTNNNNKTTALNDDDEEQIVVTSTITTANTSTTSALSSITTTTAAPIKAIESSLSPSSTAPTKAIESPTATTTTANSLINYQQQQQPNILRYHNLYDSNSNSLLRSSPYYNRVRYNAIRNNQNNSFVNSLILNDDNNRSINRSIQRLNGGSESLPRTFQPISLEFFKNNNSTSNKKSFTLKKNLYQKSLSILSNGVSPLLRRKQNKSSKSNRQQQLQQQLDFNNHRMQRNLINNQQQPLSHNLFNSSSPSTFGLSEYQQLLLNNLSLRRRKSEPIMFSYDSITNELSKFQAREENIVKNINLDFEKMLMNDMNGVNAATAAAAIIGGGGAASVGGHGDGSNGDYSSATNQFGSDQTSSAALIRQRLAAHQPQQPQFTSEYDQYGRTMINSAGAAANQHQFLTQPQQSQPQSPLQSQQSPPHQLSYQKEPFYMVYENNNNQNQQKQQPLQSLKHQQQQPQQLIHHHHSNSIPSTITTTNHHHHSHSHNDDNIYEEIDFLTLSSLRAQYADTLSLQSYKKKNNNGNGHNNNNGSKRSLASSSFTRWFSTRKKNSPSMSEDENPYIDIKLSKKQRPPITLPEIPPELTKDQLKRRYIIGSIVDSENSYINSLQRIINLYKKPLEESSPSILSQNKINIIFHRLEQILQCHTIFGIALSQCVREWDEKEQIGDVFIASFSKSMVLDIYSDFINNFTNAMETARKAAKSKSSFQQFLQEKSLSSPDRLSFFGLMVKPVQRFPQFILLLSDLLKHTPPDHHDRMSLQLALTQLESLADRLNERKRDAERHFAVKQLLKDYLSSSTTNSSNRFLLRQDDIYQLELDTSSGLVMKTKCRKLYLLNDMLVCVSVPANRLKYAVSLQDVDVMDDVTPATNNLIANSMLKSKDASSTNSSPKHCTVERMYCDLNSLIHDLEVISRVSNLLSSLRYQYQGISLDLIEQIGLEIREEIRKKDAQITLIDRSCLQIRIRSKNYKDIICIQMNDPETKKDWLTDVRLAKLALDRSNNPAWDIVNETISTNRTNQLSNSIVMHRVPLFVKSLPIFATTEHSMLTCALHYRINRRDDLILENNSGVLWICNVNENGSQLGALATNGTDISLIHSYELCDSHVTCIESVGSYAVWIGLRQGRIIVIDASSPGEWQQFAALDVSAEVTCIKYFGNFVYVGLITGVVALFNATHYEEPIIIPLSATNPVTCLLPVNKEMFACCGDKIWIINNTKLDRSYHLNNNKMNNPNDQQQQQTPMQTQQTQPQSPSNNPHFIEDDLKPNLLAHCGIGLWVSLVNSSIIKLYHTETFKHLQDVNVASNVKRVLNEMIDPQGIFVTAMLATRGLLWIGTNVGVIVTLNLPRLQGVPLISGCLNVALHRHTGPVTILLNLTNVQNDVPMHPNNNNITNHSKIIEDTDKDNQNNATNNNNNDNNNNNPTNTKNNNDEDDDDDDDMMMLMKNEDVESIYGLYSDLMNVENYVRVGHDHLNPHRFAQPPPPPSTTTAHHHLNHYGRNLAKMTWDLANINLSDDSTSESAIYQDGLIGLRGANNNTGGKKSTHLQQTTSTTNLMNISSSNKRRTIGNEHLTGTGLTSACSQREISNSVNAIESPLSPSKSQNSIYDTNNLNDKENRSSSSGIGASSSIYDLAPFKSHHHHQQQLIGSLKYGTSNPLVGQHQQQQSSSRHHYDLSGHGGPTTHPSLSSNNNNNKTALLMTGGNGYKRVSLSEQTYSSQHAHCCIWEYKL